MSSSTDSREGSRTAIASSDDLPRSVLDGLLEGVQIISPEFRYLYLNEAAARHGKRTREELTGRKMQEEYPGIAGTEMFALLQRCMTERAPRRMENEFIFPDGAKAWFELRFEPVPAGVVVLSMDITDRKRAEGALVASEQRYRALFEHMNAGFLLFEVVENDQGVPIDLVIRAANAGVTDATGWNAADILDKRLTEVLPGVERDTADWIGTYGRIALTGAAQRLERRSEVMGRDYAVAAYQAGPRLCAVTFTDITERKAAERAAQDQEERFRQVFEAANVGKSITRPTGEVFVNAALAEMLGFRREELQTKRWQDVTPPEDVPAIEATLVPLLNRTRASTRFNKRYLRKDGGLLWADVSITLVRDQAGEPAYFVTTVVDISEQKAATDALRASEERFSSAFFASPAGLTITRIADGKFIEVNDAFLRMFEVTREEAIGSNSIELGMLTPTERSKLIDAQLQAGGLRQADLRARAKSGRVVDIVFSSRPLRIAGEDCHITTMIDVTERKRAEEALRASEERHRRFAENLPDLVWRTDAKGNVLFVNGAIRGFLGLTPEEALHKPVAEHMSAASIERLSAWLKSLRGARSGFFGEVEYLDKAGQVVPGELRAAPIFDDQGAVIAVEGVTRDIRERKKVEREQAELLAQLQMSQKLEAVGRLAGGVAHDFNNLLTAILSYARFAAEGLREEDPVRADIMEVQKAGQRAAALTRQLLAFSRKQILEPSVLNLNNVVTNIERMLQRLLGEDVDIEARLADDLSPVLADPGQLEQVIMNLAVNARDAMPLGGKLTIETANVDLDAHAASQQAALAPGRYVMLSVTDTGTGIGPELREHIFEPFFTTKEKGKGTGLGLSNVWGIVKQSGGHIWVESEIGRGTSFKVCLPIASAAATQVERIPAAATAARGGETVLVVEDEDAVRRIAERVLQSAGYRVLSAASATDALHLCEQHRDPIDLLLTDVVMPGMSGPELAMQLTKLRPRLKILYMSGYTDDAIAQHGVLEPDTRLLGKPFEVADLTRKVREVLDEEPG